MRRHISWEFGEIICGNTEEKARCSRVNGFQLILRKEKEHTQSCKLFLRRNGAFRRQKVPLL